jgi:transposase
VQAAQYGSSVTIMTEEYTSGTCGRCKLFNVGHRRTAAGNFACHAPGCGYVAPRDAHGAFNIFIKATSEAAARAQAAGHPVEVH